MEEKWTMDFKKLKKSSSKKLIKGGLGFFLSPREDGSKDKEGSPTTSKDFQMSAGKKTNSWDTEGLNSEQSTEVEVPNKDYIDDIPVIPSLDDFVDDDLANQIAKAPLVGVKHVATYKELENNILRHSAFAQFEEVNLQVLIKHLHPESFLDEPDIPWTKDGLFNEMVSTINERKL